MHRCLRLNCNPGIGKFIQDMLEDCIAEYQFKMLNCMCKCKLPIEQIDNEFLGLCKLKEFNLVSNYLKDFINKKISKEKEIIEKGKNSCNKIILFCDQIFTSLQPSPQDNAMVELQ